MTIAKRLVAALLGIAGALLVAGLAFAASSDAAPYSGGAAVSVSTTTPTVGGTLTVAGSGFGANDTLSLVLHSKPYNLGTTKSDSAGGFSVSVKLPAGVSGEHTIVVSDAQTGQTQSIPVDIGGASGPDNNSGGGLSSTGVAVIGVAALAGVLLLGGGLAAFAGRRQKVSS